MNQINREMKKTALQIATETKMKISVINERIKEKTKQTEKIIFKTKMKIFEMQSLELGIKVNPN